MSERCRLKRLGERSYFCVAELALQVLGGKWKPLVLWHLGENGTTRFGALKRQMPNVTQKMLTRQLRELESDGLLTRKVYPQVPPKVEYSLTPLGKSAMPMIELMAAWGAKFEARIAPGATDHEGRTSRRATTCRLSETA